MYTEPLTTIIVVEVQAFKSLMESLSSSVGRFFHMIKLVKYKV